MIGNNTDQTLTVGVQQQAASNVAIVRLADREVAWVIHRSSDQQQLFDRGISLDGPMPQFVFTGKHALTSVATWSNRDRVARQPLGKAQKWGKDTRT